MTSQTSSFFFLSKVNWDSEKECFETFARETSQFYSMKKSVFGTENLSEVNVTTNLTVLYEILQYDQNKEMC